METAEDSSLCVASIVEVEIDSETLLGEAGEQPQKTKAESIKSERFFMYKSLQLYRLHLKRAFP